MLHQEFLCVLCAGAMYVERFEDRLIGTADVVLKRLPTVGLLDEFADELRDRDAVLGCLLSGHGGDVVGKSDGGHHEAQRSPHSATPSLSSSRGAAVGGASSANGNAYRLPPA